MKVILGIDIGTSSVKAMLLDAEKGVIAVHAKSYEVDIPQTGFAQQNPQMWWDALLEVFQQLKAETPDAYRNIKGIGFSGQMHGLVLVDKEGEVLRPAIIWLDQRSQKQMREIEEVLNQEQMGELLRNRISCGFAFPSLLWVKEEEPDLFARTAAVLCPKDYLRLKITGKSGAEVVDASSTGMFATAKRDWAWDLLEQFDLPKEIFPDAAESGDIAGYVTEEAARETGLPAGIPVIYGAGDQPAQSIGNGVTKEGKLISNIGTGGQISAFSKTPVYDKQLRTNTFCHAVKEAYTIFGATLCAGMSMNWAKNKVLCVDNYEQVKAWAGSVNPGSDGLIYLPYLSGERTPHLNPKAKGMFFGMTLGHENGHFLRAVMEGVTYSLKDCLLLLKQMGVDAPMIIASGGGAASPLWLQIQADILDREVCVCNEKEQACLGACILAGTSIGIFQSLEEGCERFVKMNEKIYVPNPVNREIYEERFGVYRELYERTKDLM